MKQSLKNKLRFIAQMPCQTDENLSVKDSRKGQGFEDVSYSGGFSHLQKGHAVVFADFDLDGDLDIFEQINLPISKKCLVVRPLYPH
jgi:hypothetical protein